MNDFQETADRVEIEALRGEFTDAAMMRDRARLAALFTTDGVLSMPNIPVRFTGREEIRLGGERLQAQWDFFVQNTHPGVIRIDGDTATGRAYIEEIARVLDGRSGLNFAIYHDTYRRTPEGWRFAERVYEVRYLDTTPLKGAAPGEGAAEEWAAAEGVAGTGRAGGEVVGVEGVGVGSAGEGVTGFDAPASPDRLARTVEALRANGFTVELLDDAEAARARVKELIPAGATVFTGASETLRLSGITRDIEEGGHCEAIRPRVVKMDRATESDRIRRLVATPDVYVASVTAVTETGALVIASATGSQLPASAGGAGRAIWIIGAQKVVPDLPTALRRIEEHALPLESVRAQAVYGQPSAVNRLLILNAEPQPGRGTVLLLREAIGY
ncbi:LUD domain-containing protein [Streptomyces sp. 4F14]|uniref:LUD domain-containing protein n=1 Tax=Streptomyces sp. 4F14 TaxID=3394380 RepID=UPI003A854AB2